MEEGLTVKEVSTLTGLSAHTLRYYEREGLVGPVARADSGHRRYSGPDLALIELLHRLRITGMPIRKMKLFADLWREGDATRLERRVLLEAHGAEVRRRVAELRTELRAIEAKVEVCKAEMEASMEATAEPDGADPVASGLDRMGSHGF